MNIMNTVMWTMIGRGVATIAVCLMGAYAFKVSGGDTGLGWAILGVLLIWGS